MSIKKYTKKESRDFGKYLIEKCEGDTPYFNNIFDFIPTEKLRKFLLKSYREAHFVSNLVNTLEIKYTMAHPLNEIQILHYAYICEALIDFTVETYLNINPKTPLLTKTVSLTTNCIIDSNLKNDIDKLWQIRNGIHINRAVSDELKFFKKMTQGHDDLVVRLCSSLRNSANNNVN